MSTRNADLVVTGGTTFDTPGTDGEDLPRYYGWRVLLAAIVGQAFSPGPVVLVLLGILAQDIARSFEVTVPRVLVAITVFNLCSIPAAPLVGRLADRFGARRVLLASSAAMLIFLLALGTVTRGLYGLYALFATAGIATMGAQSITYGKLVTSWFDRRRGVALGLSAAGLGLGYTILPLIVSAGFGATTWQGAVLLLAAVMAILPLVLNLAFARLPSAAQAPNTDPTFGLTLREAARTRAFRVIGIAVFLVSFVSTGLVPNLFSLARDVGVPMADMAFTASAFGISTLAGRVVIGGLLDRLFAPWVAAVAFALSGLGFVLLAAVASTALGTGACLWAVVLVGLGFAAESDVIGYFTSRYFGLRYFGRIYGCLLSLFIVGAAGGASAFAFARDVIGTFSFVFGAAAFAVASAALLMLIMPAYPVLPAADRKLS